MSRFLAFVLLLLVLWAGAAAADALAPPPGHGILDLAGHIDILHDKNGTLTIEDVAASPSFRPLPGYLHDGFSDATVWLRFTVATGDGEWWLEMAPSYVDDIQVFLPDPAQPGRFRRTLLGDHIPVSAQDLRYHRPIMRFEPAGATTVYVRVRSTSSMTLAPRLISGRALVEESGTELLEMGIFYGIRAAMFLVALLCGLWMRYPRALLFALYLVPSTTAQFVYEGLAARWLYPDLPALADRATSVTLCLTIAINLWIFRLLLETPVTLPRTDRLYRAMSWVGVAAAVPAALGYWQGLNLGINLLALLMLVSTVAGAVALVCRGVPSARFIFVAFTVYSAILAFILLRNLGLIDAPFQPFWGMRAASIIPVLAIGAAVANHLRQTHRAARQAQAAALAAEAADRAKSAFLAMMSHELRTPMGGILSVVELLRSTGLSAQQQELVDTLGESGRSLLTILNDILDWSKLEQGRVETEQTPFAPGELARSVTDLLRGKAGEKGVRLELTLSPDLPAHALGDPMRLRQVLMNLLGNAVKFTERGSVHLDVGVSAESGMLRFAIADTGIGMSPETVAGLFTPFQQGDASISRRFGGTGLGLSISRRLAQAMGGDIAVTSVPGQGSTFTLSLPCPPAQAPAGPPPAIAPAVRRPLSILLAEDTPLNQKIIPLVLERMGHRVEVAGDGVAALRMVAERPAGTFDLILMDMQMPNMDGLEATRAIRALGDGRARIPIVALTANAFDSDRDRCLAAGMDAHLSKPVIPERVTAVLAEVLG